MKTFILLLLIMFSFFLSFSSAAQCGRQAGGALCPKRQCCSKFGWCGTTETYCRLPDCQSGCPPVAPPPPADPIGGLSDIISRSQFNEMFKHTNDSACPARGFYTYDNFIEAAKHFRGFGNSGDTSKRKKEIAAFLAQTSYQTTGGGAKAPDGPYAWGYCHKEEVNPSSNYCSSSEKWPCVPGKSYHGRGPMQLKGNNNYGQCGNDLREDLLNNPDLVSTDPWISFASSIWYWMEFQSPRPSCHAAILDMLPTTEEDTAAGRVTGYGMVTNVINGDEECGHGYDARVADRIGFYKRYCKILGADPGDNLDCYKQKPYGPPDNSPPGSGL